MPNKPKANPVVRNIGLKTPTYDKLVSYCHKNETFDNAVNRLLHDIEHVNFELISVDGGPPIDHEVVCVIGNAKYRCSKGVYELIAVP